MRHIANALASLGRHGDTELLHVTKGELDGINRLSQAHGLGSLPVNPHTGLKEASLLSTLLPIVGAAAGSLLLPGLGTAGGAAVGGALGGAAGQKMSGGSPLQGALMGGAMGAVGGELAGGGFGPSSAPVDAAPGYQNFGLTPAQGAQYAAQGITPADLASNSMLAGGPGAPTPALTPYQQATTYGGKASALAGEYPLATTALGGAAAYGLLHHPAVTPQTHQVTANDPTGLRVAPGGGGGGVYDIHPNTTYTDTGPATGPTNFASAGYTPGGAYNPTPYNTQYMGYASGGAVSSSGIGSLPPTYLQGQGDGMSDDIPGQIPATQPGQQPEPIAVADGEYIIPSDVVSHLGNGSSNAGAKHLDKVMAHIRKERTGNPKQGKEINPDKVMWS